MSKKCTPLWREAHFQVKMYKTPQRRTTFGSCDVEKVHAVVARSTFRSQNVQSTRGSDHFWKLRCRKSARRCGAKHISKSKCTKHTMLGPLLEVRMSKKCTPLWREAHFQVKMYKTLRVSDHFVEVQMSLRFASLHTLHYITLHYTPLHYITLHYYSHNTTYYNYTNTQLHSYTTYTTTLHYTASALPSTTLKLHSHYTPLHKIHYVNTLLHYIQSSTTPAHITLHTLHTLHYLTTLHSLHYATFPLQQLLYTTLLSTTLQLQLHNYTPHTHYTTLH